MTATLPQTDDAIFLRAICDSPFNDLPRLVFADWLEETGHYEKAVRIRRMIETSEDSLMEFHEGRWLEVEVSDVWTGLIGNPVNRLRDGNLEGCPAGILSRGFLGELHCTQAEFMGVVDCSCSGPGLLWLTCPDCDGSGRHGGFVDQFDRLPITTVVLTDCEPAQACVAIGRKRAGLKPLGLRFDGMAFVGIDPSH